MSSVRRLEIFKSMIVSRLPLAAVLIVVAISFVPQHSLAQGYDVFAIGGIEVDETAESDALAKERGLAVAKRQALTRLFARLTLPEDKSRLPIIGPDRLEFLLRDVAIEAEKFGGGRYIATLAVRFQARAVRDLFRQSGIAYVETVSPRLLVVPVLRTVNGDVLWQDGNPWLDAWAEQPPSEGMVPIVPPLGDLADMTAIDAERAIAGDLNALSALARRYSTAGAIVTTVALSTTPEEVSKADVGVTVFGPGWGGRSFVGTYLETPETASEAAGDGTKDPTEVARERLRLFLRDVGAQISQALEFAWKRENLLRFDLGSQTIDVIAPLSGLSDWLAVRRGLAAAPPVSDVILNSLSIDEAQVGLTFVGDEAKLTVALAQVGLDLIYSEEDAVWTVTRRSQ